jgi:hypothetical protein
MSSGSSNGSNGNGGKYYGVSNGSGHHHLPNNSYRSYSAGPMLSGSQSNHQLLGGKKSNPLKAGNNNNQLPPHVGMKLPPLPHTSQESTSSMDGPGGVGDIGDAAVRYVQSAPAVSRSVNLPPIQPSTFLQPLLQPTATGGGAEPPSIVSTSANMVPFSSGLSSKTPKPKRLKPIYTNVHSTPPIFGTGASTAQSNGGNMSGRRLQKLFTGEES